MDYNKDISNNHEQTMDVSQSSSNEIPREVLVNTAVNFLRNAKIRHTTGTQKQQFLQSKGLSTTEIQLAFDRAGVCTKNWNARSPTAINMDINATRSTHTQLAWSHIIFLWRGIKDMLQSLALFSAVIYAIYLFWKKYFHRFLFGSKIRRNMNDASPNIQTAIGDQISEFKEELTQFRVIFADEQRKQMQQFLQEFQHFKTDLETIKGLLLNIKHFPAAPVNIAEPSIPAWQLSSVSHHIDNHENVCRPDDQEKVDDVGSGSGSSETEVVTKNSDSSLEIM